MDSALPFADRHETEPLAIIQRRAKIPTPAMKCFIAALKASPDG